MSNLTHYYKHTAPESLVSKFVKHYLKVTDRKNSLLKIMETKQFNHIPAPIPRSLLRMCDVEKLEVKGRPVWKFSPKKNRGEKTVFFSHGGGHLNNITSHHWRMIAYLIRRTGATFIVPDYPLLPDYDYRDTYDMIEESFFATANHVDSANLIFLGDSAGGAISLALAQLLRDKNNVSQPSKLILITPELDASKLHEDIPLYEPFDVMLTGQIFDVISPDYVGDCPRDHFLVSPGLGNLDGLGHISIFSGTHDILYTYAQDFKKRLEKEGHNFHYYEYPKMMHVWTAIVAMKEARSALNQMVELINDEEGL